MKDNDILDLIDHLIPNKNDIHEDVVNFVEKTILLILDKYGYDKFEIDAPINFNLIKSSFADQQNLYNLKFKETITDKFNRYIEIYLKNKLISSYRSKMVNNKYMAKKEYYI